MSSTAPDHVPTNIPPSDIRLPVKDWERVQEAARKSRSHNTKIAYRTYLSAWTAHARKRGVEAKPAHPAAVAEWLTSLADEGKSISTLQVARAAVAAAHREEGLDDPTTTELVRRVLSGLTREAAKQGRRPSQVKGLTRGDLQRILAHFTRPNGVPQSRILLRDLALVQVMRDGLLRRSEAANLMWGDVISMEDGSGRLTIRHSKTDPEGKGAVMYLAPSTMAALNRIRPEDAQPHQAVFGVSGPHLSTRIKVLAERAGLGSGYSGHSCRIGMAQDLAAHGATLAQLMTAGRWTNPTMPALYTRNQTAANNAVAQYYQQLTLLDRHPS